MMQDQETNGFVRAFEETKTIIGLIERAATSNGATASAIQKVMVIQEADIEAVAQDLKALEAEKLLQTLKKTLAVLQAQVMPEEISGEVLERFKRWMSNLSITSHFIQGDTVFQLLRDIKFQLEQKVPS